MGERRIDHVNGRRHTSEQIVRKLREADRLLSEGVEVPEIAKALEVSEQTYHRCEQLRADPRVPSQRLRELAVEIGYAGGKTVFDAYVREVRPRFLVKRTFQRTVYRPAELIQCDL
jgi:DNA-binding transcriptional MerR regulator